MSGWFQLLCWFKFFELSIFFAAGKEIPLFLLNRIIHYGAHECLPSHSILNQLDAANTFTPCFICLSWRRLVSRSQLQRHLFKWSPYVGVVIGLQLEPRNHYLQGMRFKRGVSARKKLCEYGLMRTVLVGQIGVNETLPRKVELIKCVSERMRNCLCLLARYIRNQFYRTAGLKNIVCLPSHFHWHFAFWKRQCVHWCMFAS